MASFMTQAEYARYRKSKNLAGGTPAAVLKAIRTGRITMTDAGIDPDVADAEWEASTRKKVDLHLREPDPIDPDQAKAVPAQKSAASQYADAKTRTEEAVASMKEMELAKRRGELVDKAGVERSAYQFGRIIQKSLVDVLPSKLAMELATLVDPWEIECFLRDKIRQELSAISETKEDTLYADS